MKKAFSRYANTFYAFCRNFSIFSWLKTHFGTNSINFTISFAFYVQVAIIWWWNFITENRVNLPESSNWQVYVKRTRRENDFPSTQKMWRGKQQHLCRIRVFVGHRAVVIRVKQTSRNWSGLQTSFAKNHEFWQDSKSQTTCS